MRGNTNADLVVRFVKQEDDDYLKDKPSVLAYAYFPNGQAIGGDMTFNDSIWWSLSCNLLNFTQFRIFLTKLYPRANQRMTMSSKGAGVSHRIFRSRYLIMSNLVKALECLILNRPQS